MLYKVYSKLLNSLLFIFFFSQCKVQLFLIVKSPYSHPLSLFFSLFNAYTYTNVIVAGRIHFSFSSPPLAIKLSQKKKKKLPVRVPARKKKPLYYLLTLVLASRRKKKKKIEYGKYVKHVYIIRWRKEEKYTLLCLETRWWRRRSERRKREGGGVDGAKKERRWVVFYIKKRGVERNEISRQGGSFSGSAFVPYTPRRRAYDIVTLNSSVRIYIYPNKMGERAEDTSHV